MTTGFTLEEVATTIQPNVAYSLGSLFTTEPTTDIQGALGIDFSSTSTQGWVFSAILGGISYPADFGASAGYTINNVPSSSSAGTDAQFISFDGSINGEPGITFEPLGNISITFSQSFLNSHPTFTLADLPGLSLNIQDQFSSATFGGSTGTAYENSFNTIPIDYAGALTTSATITITAPTAVTINAGESDGISGISIAGSSNASDVFTVTLSDTNGRLSAGGQANTSLTVSGSLAVVNNTLAALTDTDGVVAPDTIIVTASDSEGNPSTPASIAVTVNGNPITITAPPSQTIGVGKTHDISGVSITGSADPTDVFTVTVSDTNGILAAGGQAATSLTVSGSLDDVNGVLGGLTDTDSVTGSDTIIITGSDTEKNFALPADIPVTVNGVPTITAPTNLSPATGLATVLAGISIAETGNTSGETFTVVLQDATGILGAKLNVDVAGNGSTNLTITGDIGSVNAELATLTDTATDNDTIQMTVTDSFNNMAAPTSITVAPIPISPTVLIIKAPKAATVGVGQTTPIGGISVTEAPTTTGETFIAALTDTNGVLSATTSAKGGGGTITPSNGGKTLTIRGTLAQLNADLTTLTDTDGSTAADTITVNAKDSNGGIAAPASIAVTVNGVLGNGSFTVGLSGSNNTVTIGNGNSKVSGGQNANIIVIGNGNSTVSLSGSSNSVTFGNGNESVTIGGGGNKITVGNGNSTISLGGGGNTVTAGNGNDTITLAGSGSTIKLGNGTDTVHGGTGDTINIAGNTTLTLYGTNEMVFIGTGNSTINDFSTGLGLKIGPTAGNDILSHFATSGGDTTGVVDLIGGIGGFTTTAAVLAALKSDGQGGTLLSFGHGSSLDFAGVAVSQLHASNFQIG